MSHEDHITEHLVRSLVRTKSLPGRIIYQYTLLAEDENGNVSISGNIDFVLTVGDDEGRLSGVRMQTVERSV